ncbi:MAG: hypothetical protein M0D55_20485 [Elusimicrobiota bacterium]|nr:MAG: hypothetical protein M0D55_20485 [Elusimicrobiota bacterium]
MTEYRLTKQGLWDILEAWDQYLPSPVRVVACGGTALTLQDLKESTKDVDFLVPMEDEYKALIRTIRKLDYRQQRGSGWKKDDSVFIFDLFLGKTVFTTELLDSPLEEGKSALIRKFDKLEVRALNDLDLIISKMFRGTDVDVEDCLTLMNARGAAFDVKALEARYAETAKYDVGQDKVMRNLGLLLAEYRPGGDSA